MPREFKNPLTQPSQRSEPTREEERIIPPSVTAAPAIPSAPPSVQAPPAQVRARRKAEAFEKRHERMTLWVDKRLKQQFENLAYREGITKTALINEALADLLGKYGVH